MINLEYPRARTVHNVKNRQGCEYVGGYWEAAKQICMMDEIGTVITDAGWTAPIHGAYFWYEITDDPGWGPPFAHVVGCLVKESEDYPSSPGMCSAIYDKDFDLETINIFNADDVVDHFEEVVRDAMNLRLKKHRLILIDPPKEKIRGLPDQPFIGYPGILKDFKEGRKKIVPFRIRGV